MPCKAFMFTVFWQFTTKSFTLDPPLPQNHLRLPQNHLRFYRYEFLQPI